MAFKAGKSFKRDHAGGTAGSGSARTGTDMPGEEVLRSVRELLASVVPDGARVRILGADEDLTTSAKLDSLSFIAFLSALERSFGVDLSTRLDELRSVRTLAQVAEVVADRPGG